MRRFRFEGKKEAAGVAVAVIQAGIMEIECRFVIRSMLLGLPSLPMVLKSGEQLDEPSAIKPLEHASESGLEAVPRDGETLLRRRGWSKPAGRIVGGGHEESNLAK